MLVLSRSLKKGKLICLDDRGKTFMIEVVEMSGGQVKLAIDAPHEFKFYREEVLSEEEKMVISSYR